MSFSELSTKEMLTSPPCDVQGARCFSVDPSTLPLQGKKEGLEDLMVDHDCATGIFKTVWLTLALVLFLSSHSVNS